MLRIFAKANTRFGLYIYKRMQAHWEKRYAEEAYAYGTDANEFLVEQLAHLKAGKILFVCEGEGRNAVYAASLGWEVEAFDLSEEGKKKALKLAQQKDQMIHYQIADAAIIDYPLESFDAVALIYAHFPEEIREKIHKKTTTWLKPGGHILLEAFNPLQLNNSSGGPKELSMLYTKEMMRKDFEGLDFSYLSEEKTELNEGQYHIGKADITRVVAVKP